MFYIGCAWLCHVAVVMGWIERPGSPQRSSMRGAVVWLVVWPPSYYSLLAFEQRRDALLALCFNVYVIEAL